jgi:hypothetical protein
MSQLGRFDHRVPDTLGNAISGASVAIYREGATVNGNQSGTSPLTVTAWHRGKIAAADTVFVNTTTGTTYSVDSVTATTVVLSGFAGTLALTGGDRITPSNSQPTLYSDDQGGATTTNPLTTSSTGRAQCWMNTGAYDVIVSGGGATTTAFVGEVTVGESPATVISGETDSATAVAHIEDTYFSLATAGGKLKSWRNAGVEKAYLGQDGTLSINGDLIVSGSVTPAAFGNIRWAHLYDSATSETGGIQEAIDSITDASETNPYTVMLRPGIYDVTHADTAVVGINVWGTGLDGTGDSRNWIALAGMDAATCIITRTTAASSLVGVIQACHNQYISNLTIDCEVTRHIHWDPTVVPAGGALLDCQNVRFLSVSGAASQSGISAGATGGSAASTKVRIHGCHFQSGAIAIHGGSGADVYGVEIWITANTFDLTGAIAGFSIPSIAEPWSFYVSGNVQKYYNVDPGSGGINLNMPTIVADGKHVKVVTDGSLRATDTVTNPNVVTDNSENYFYNAFVYPMEHTGTQCLTGVTSGDVIVYRPASGDYDVTTTANDPWPAVCCNQLDTTSTANWFPRLCAGPMGVCFVESAQVVAPGDTLVTSVTAKDAFVNNAQTDMTRIIGWAINGKTAGTRRLVTFRRNMTLAW